MEGLKNRQIAILWIIGGIIMLTARQVRGVLFSLTRRELILGPWMPFNRWETDEKKKNETEEDHPAEHRFDQRKLRGQSKVL